MSFSKELIFKILLVSGRSGAVLSKVIVRKDSYSCFTFLVSWMVKVLLFVAVIATFVPLFPAMPAASLDPSWILGMNQVVAQSMRIGTDVVFTFGPYSSVYTSAYHPATDLMMLSGSLYLAVICWLCLLFLTNKNNLVLLFSFIVLLTGLMYSRDALLFFVPLLVGLSTFKLCLPSQGFNSLRIEVAFVVLVFSSLGFLPLVKGSLLVLCGAIYILCLLLFLTEKRYILMLFSFLSPLLSMVVFWVAAGQSGPDLLAYYINMVPIVSGYTEAMAVEGDFTEVVEYAVASFLLLCVIIVNTRHSLPFRIFLICLYFVFLFLSFKAGFVRHDGHALMASMSLLIACLTMFFLFKNWISIALVVPSLVAGLYIGSNHAKVTFDTLLDNIFHTFTSVWVGAEKRLLLDDWPRSSFDRALDTLRREANFPLLNGTADIYSFNQSYLIASGNTWQPRPVFQSYSAFTQKLIEMNKRHLIGSGAPDNIVFRVEPIDGRLPSMEDGASWPVLLGGYSLALIDKNFVYLKKDTFHVSEDQSVLLAGNYRFNDVINLPSTNEPVFANVQIKPTLFGRIAGLVFKPTQLQITVKLNSGMEKKYRIVSEMVKAGFLASPLIEDTNEFGMLYGPPELLIDKRVRAISVTPVNDSGWIWQNEFSVVFSRVKPKASSVFFKIYKLNGFETKLSEKSTFAVERCDGNIDKVNEVTPFPQNVKVNSFLRVNGWLVSSVENGILPDKTFVVLTDKNNNHTFINTARAIRPDVAVYFNKAELGDAGYSVLADVSSLKGDYTMELAGSNAGKTIICSNIKINVTINSQVQQ